MISTVISMMIVFVGWISYRACIGSFPFLAEYLVYVNWAVPILEGVLFIGLIVAIVMKLAKRR